jgi:tetratricopeptide (TPR) repeat protein
LRFRRICVAHWRTPCISLGMNDFAYEAETISFGDLSEATNELLQQGVAAYRRDRAKADELFRSALAAAPRELAAYYCLYKIHTYMGNLDVAHGIAIAGMNEAARQAGWPSNPALWPPQISAGAGAARFALFTLKALSFIELKRGRREQALDYLRVLSFVDPSGSVGWHVIMDLANGVA